MRFIVDANLPVPLAKWLIDQGHEAKHVHHLGLSGTSDQSIWSEARKLNATIITKDYDFVRLHQSDSTISVVHVTRGNIKRDDLINYFDLIFPQLVTALQAGETLIEVS